MANLRADNLTGTGGRNAIDGSLFFDGADSYLVCTDNSDFALGTGDFTVEGWFLVDTNLDYRSFIDTRTSVNDDWMIGMRSNDRIYVYAGAFLLESPTGSVTPGHWHHVAYVRSSGTHALYLNGVSVATSSTSKDYDSQKLAISAPPYNVGAEEFKGYVSNVRIIKGTAVYTAAFTPPTEKLTAVSGTVLLCCQDSDDALQEATGKTITGYGRYANTDTELVTNHSFNNGTTGWTLSDANEGSMAVVNGSLVLTNDDTNDPPVYAWQAVTLVVGQTYDLKVHFSGGTNSPGSNLAVYLHTSSSFGSSAGGSMTADSVSGNGIKIHRFKATVATTYLLLRVNANAAGTSIFSAASIKASDPGKAPKVLPSVGVDEGVTFEGDTKINSKNYMYFPTGDTSQRGRGRGLFFGGYSPGTLNNIIEYVEIQSQGNAIDFGDLLATNNGEGGNCSSSTRGLAGGGLSNIVDITYVTIATTSNATDFGDLLTGRRSLAGASSSTRGVFAGGTTPTMKNEIEYVTIASTGDALDFGNLTVARRNLAPAGSPTRGVFAGGNPGSSPNLDDTIDYITIASTGNAADFGNLSGAYREMGGTSSSTRAIFGGGSPGSAHLNIIEYITIATTGNATDFGDLHTGRSGMSGTSNGIRGIFAGGSYINNIQYVTIATTGNASDFGDLTLARFLYGAASDSHGGIS